MSADRPDRGREAIPDLVRLTTYAILGGVVGQPVSFVFRDFPPDVLTALWGYFARSLHSDQVVEVWSQTDVRKVVQKIHDFRLVLVYPGNKMRASNVLEWIVESRRGGRQSLPTVLSVHHDGTNETSGSTLVANGSPAIAQEILDWLLTRRSGEIAPILSEGGCNEVGPQVTCDRLKKAICEANVGKCQLSLRDVRIVEGLIAGATLHRNLRTGTTIDPVLKACPEDYATLRPLLESSFLQNVHVPVDDLTKAMVERSNLYLEIRSAGSPSPTRPLGARRGSTSTVDEPKTSRRHRSLSRNELADLGNPRSPILKKLVAKVVASNNRTLLTRLGLPRPEAIISRLGEDYCTKQVLEQVPTWTYKKVRTRFERLKTEGLIEVMQEESNSPCRYVLPLEVTMQRSRFAALPDDNAVSAAYG